MDITNGDMAIIKDALISLYNDNDRIIKRTEYWDVAESYMRENDKVEELFKKLYHITMEEYFNNL